MDDQIVFLDQRGAVQGAPVRVNGLAVAQAYRPDGRMLAVSRGDGRILIVDVVERRVRHTLTEGDSSAIPAGLAWHPDGRTLAVSLALSRPAVLRPDRTEFLRVDPARWADLLCGLLIPSTGQWSWQGLGVDDVCGGHR